MALHEKKHRSKWEIAGLAAALAVIMLLIWQKDLISNALFDSSRAVRINPDEIENSTLIIGTHLIYLHAMNDQLYEIAKQSASDSGQDRVYYKSEMAGGLWYDITDAESLKDITTDGVIVSNDDIRSLYFTHHTKSDRITYDLQTNSSVCIFNIYPIYELESMSELEPLKLQYDTMKESQSEDETVKRNLQLTSDFFKTEVKTSTSELYGQQLDALQGYYEELVNNDASSTETESVLNVMEKVDAARKAAVFTIVDYALENLQTNVADTKTKQGEDDEEDTIYTIDDALLTAIGNAQSSVSESMTEAQGKMLEQGSTVLSATEYELSQNLINTAQSHNYASCDGINAKLIDLKHIIDGKIVKRSTELSLAEEMIAKADVKYQQILSQGESTLYKTKAGENASHAALENIIKQDLTDVNAVRSELQFLIQSKTDRLENEAARSYVLTRIQESSVFTRQIKQDAYQSAMKNTVDQYIAWLNDLLVKVKKEGNTQTETDSLYEEKADLQEQQLEALDSLNLDTAKKLEIQIAVVDEKIADLEKNAESKLNSLTEQKSTLEKQIAEHPEDDSLQEQLADINAQIASTSADMSDGSEASNIISMKNEAMNYLKEGDTSASAMQAVTDCIDGLGGMMQDGSSLALNAMKDIYQQMVSESYLGNADQYDDMIQQMEQTLEEADLSSLAAQTASDISSDQAVATLEEELGVSLDGEMSQADQDAAILALSQSYEETQSSEIKEVLDAQIIKAMESGNEDIFESYKENRESYAPAEVVAHMAGYRYLWNDTRKTAVLSRGAKFYTFTTFYNTVGREDGKEETMDVQAAFQGRIYLPDSYISKNFGCQVSDISGTDYSVLVNDTVIEKSQELSSKLLEKGGN